MNYRNKRPYLNHKVLLQTVDQTMLDKAFVKKIDFFGNLKKDLQQCQNEWGIKCQKECTITSKCMAKFIESYIQRWHKTNEKEKHIKESKYHISEEQIKKRLMKALTQKIDQDNEVLMENQCKKMNMMNTDELAETYINRISKLLHQQIEQQNRAESVQLDQYSNRTSQIGGGLLVKQRSLRGQKLIGFSQMKNQESSLRTSKAAIESQPVPSQRVRRVPQKKNSETVLLKQSEATTNDQEGTQQYSKQATPVSGRRIIFNGGTIISKDSFADENKSGDVSPINQKKSGNQGAFSSLSQRKLSFQNLVRNKTPVRKPQQDVEAALINPFDKLVEVVQIKKESKQYTIIDKPKETHKQSNNHHYELEHSSPPSTINFFHQESSASKMDNETDGEMVKMIRAMNRIAGQHDSFLESDRNENLSSQFATGVRNIEDEEGQQPQEFELMMDSVFLEKNFSTPIRYHPPLENNSNSNINGFGDYVAQEVENKMTRT